MAIPTFRELCIDFPLYREVEAGDDDRKALADLRDTQGQFDAHCIDCGAASIFKFVGHRGGGAGYNPRPTDWMFEDALFSVRVGCGRNSKHEYFFLFQLKGRKLQKIGQYPALATLAESGIADLRKALGNKFSSELARAVGLASHGVGIGAFVYLRRIFEHLIHETHAELENAGKAVQGFDALRMDEKILALKTQLPPAMVKNRAVYGVLSLHIHELTEEMCLANFDVVLRTITLILDQQLKAKKELDDEKALEREIQKLAQAAKAHKKSG